MDILTQLDHPNIIKVFEEYEDEMYYHFVMEFSSGGELLERIVKKGNLECIARILKGVRSQSDNETTILSNLVCS